MKFMISLVSTVHAWQSSLPILLNHEMDDVDYSGDLVPEIIVTEA